MHNLCGGQPWVCTIYREESSPTLSLFKLLPLDRAGQWQVRPAYTRGGEVNTSLVLSQLEIIAYLETSMPLFDYNFAPIHAINTVIGL